MYTGYIHKIFLKNYKKNELILYIASPAISNNPRIAVQVYCKLHVKNSNIEKSEWRTCV